MRYIEFRGKKGKLITPHPEHSCLLKKHNGRITTLRLSDPEKFWNISKYWVIVAN